jgi:hypothetical protein
MTDATLRGRFDAADARITRWMAAAGIPILRVALGVVFVWFGALKFFPGMSPAEDLVRATVPFLPGDLVPSLPGVLGGRDRPRLPHRPRAATDDPPPLPPDARHAGADRAPPGARLHRVFPFGLTLEGQYIVKNLVLIAAALVIGATVRGGRLVDGGHAAGGPRTARAHSSGITSQRTR